MNLFFIGFAILIIIIIGIAMSIGVGITPRRSFLDLRAEEFPNVNPRYFENWQFHIGEAQLKSIWVSKLFILSVASAFFGLKVFLYSFLSTSILVIFVFYRIWRVPNEYMKEIGLSRTDVKLALKKSIYD